MNEFLDHLAQQRQSTSREGEWNQWKAAHIYDGHNVWDARGSAAVSASVSAFLSMVPKHLYRSGIAIVAPRYLHDGAQMVPGVVRTDIRFLHNLGSVPDEVLDIWRREGAAVKYVHIDRSYLVEGYTTKETFLVLEDGRLVGINHGFFMSMNDLYEGMAQFIVTNNL